MSMSVNVSTTCAAHSRSWWRRRHGKEQPRLPLVEKTVLPWRKTSPDKISAHSCVKHPQCRRKTPGASAGANTEPNSCLSKMGVRWSAVMFDGPGTAPQRQCLLWRLQCALPTPTSRASKAFRAADIWTKVRALNTQRSAPSCGTLSLKKMLIILR